jgi:hypothetical protein
MLRTAVHRGHFKKRTTENGEAAVTTTRARVTPDLIGGELLGATLGERWGAINQRYGDEGGIALIFGLVETDRGLAFGSQEVAWNRRYRKPKGRREHAAASLAGDCPSAGDFEHQG